VDLGEGTVVREKLFQLGNMQMLKLVSTPTDSLDYALLKPAFDTSFSLSVLCWSRRASNKFPSLFPLLDRCDAATHLTGQPTLAKPRFAPQRLNVFPYKSCANPKNNS